MPCFNYAYVTLAHTALMVMRDGHVSSVFATVLGWFTIYPSSLSPK